METDRLIALFVRGQKDAEELEKKKELWAAADPKRRISYSLEELKTGVQRGEMYLYTLKLCFETKEIFDGKLTVPFIRDCFDVMEEVEDHELWVSKKRKTSFLTACAPSGEPGDFETWVGQVKTGMELSGLQLKNLQIQSAGSIDYMSYETASAEGLIYNLQFRFWKEGLLCVGIWNCMAEEKMGWGLLQEAMLHVMEEMNFPEGGLYGNG